MILVCPFNVLKVLSGIYMIVISIHYSKSYKQLKYVDSWIIKNSFFTQNQYTSKNHALKTKPKYNKFAISSHDSKNSHPRDYFEINGVPLKIAMPIQNSAFADSRKEIFLRIKVLDARMNLRNLGEMPRNFWVVDSQLVAGTNCLWGRFNQIEDNDPVKSVIHKVFPVV